MNLRVTFVWPDWTRKIIMADNRNAFLLPSQMFGSSPMDILGSEPALKLVLTDEAGRRPCVETGYQTMYESLDKTGTCVYFLVLNSSDKHTTIVLAALIPSSWANMTQVLPK